MHKKKILWKFSSTYFTKLYKNNFKHMCSNKYKHYLVGDNDTKACVIKNILSTINSNQETTMA